MVKDTDPSSNNIGPLESLTSIGSNLFFSGYDPANGWALWKR